MRYWHLYFLLLLLTVSCSPKGHIVKELKLLERDLKEHTGFALYDPARKKSLIEYQADKYFTPASNTKIFTLYTSLNVLGDSVESIRYTQRNDSLIFWGMADPSFLYKNTYDNGRTFTFLSEAPGRLFFSSSNFQTERLGPGWAWDDYSSNYSPERSPFPIYGNLIYIEKLTTGFNIRPFFFNQHFTLATVMRRFEEIVREQDSNQLTFFPGQSRSTKWDVPFRSSSDLAADLLADTLKRTVEEIDWPVSQADQSLHSIPADSLYRVMMQDSDNFIAEQLLLQCAAVVSDTLKPEIAIKFAKERLLADLPDEPQWVDGSGLSRYNLFTPRSIVRLWEKIYVLVPQERLFPLLATGGKYGTIKNWYKAESPYIFGKTGSLRNNHSLSGYVVTKKGKVLIFSMMSNNFVSPVSEVRKRMQKILETIRDNY